MNNNAQQQKKKYLIKGKTLNKLQTSCSSWRSKRRQVKYC